MILQRGGVIYAAHWGDRIIATCSGLDLEYRLRQQALLAELGRRALSVMPLESLLEEAARLVALGMETEFCKVLEYQPENNRLLVRAGVGWGEGVVGEATVGANLESPAGYALHTGKPVIANDLSAEERFRTPELLRSHGIRRAINVILLTDGKPFGVLEVDTRCTGAFSEHDIDFMQGAAGLLGMAISRLRAHQALRDINETLENRVAAEVSERRAAEAALAQAQKMEAVGQLTGGVAHDFNNLLMIISGNLDMASRAVKHDERISRLIASAQKATERGKQLTSQLLAFARSQSLRPETSQINELIGEFNVLAGRILSDMVEVDFDLALDAWHCEIDPAQFGSALLNLVLNARDAMPHGGQVTIRTRNVKIDIREASRMSGASPGNYVLVIVEDTGIGMTRDLLGRVFEPFFTTKVGKGTGLGLSQVYGFVQQSGGFVDIESVLEKGTTIKMYFPRVEPVLPYQLSTLEEPRAGSEAILVVEDDSDVRALFVEMLGDLGYRTHVARNGPEALDSLMREPEIAMLLTDVLIPGGLTGIDLAHEAQRLKPKLRVLLTSGHAAPEQLIDSQNAETFALIVKPYKQAELGRKLREIFDQNS
jgi:signal transduction histidine kinase/CheY-like chemotaxis protein